MRTSLVALWAAMTSADLSGLYSALKCGGVVHSGSFGATKVP